MLCIKKSAVVISILVESCSGIEAISCSTSNHHFLSQNSKIVFLKIVRFWSAGRQPIFYGNGIYFLLRPAPIAGPS
jgi:hypothetical protein